MSAPSIVRNFTLVVGVSLALFGGAVSLSAQAIVVEPAVRISPPGTGNHFFTNIAADPGDARHLLACGVRASAVANTWQGFVYRSSDSGKSWSTAMVDSSGERVSEEACAFGPDGHAYFNAETWNPRYELRRLGNGIVRFYRSLNAGRTWTPAIVDPTHDSWMDYARIGVDLSDGPYRGRVYVFSNSGMTDPPGQPVSPMRYSVDGGLHVSERVRLPLPQPAMGGFPNVVAVLPGGTVVAAYLNHYAPNGAFPPPIDTTKEMPLIPRRISLIQVVRSADGGRTLEAPITVAPGQGFPGMAADLSTGPYHGRLYLAWSDTLGHRSHLFLATSDDDGKTWTPPRLVDDLPAPEKPAKTAGPVPGWIGARDPQLAVNREGVVGLTWAENDACWHFTASRDGGRTFLPSVLLNACSAPPAPGFQPTDQMRTVPRVDPTDRLGKPDLMRTGFTVRVDLGGGAAGLAADAAGAFHPLWSISGTDGRLWTTRVTVRPNDAPRPAPATSLAGLADVSARVTFDFSNQDYDVATGLLSLDLTLVNRDSLPISGPVRVQVTRVSSGVAPAVEIADADNGQRGAGAVWDLSAALPGGRLEGYGRSAPRRVRFRFPHGLVGGPMALSPMIPSAPLVATEVKVFAAP